MSGALFESSWYRVAELKPRLQGHARIHRHHYRGQLWYVLQDNVSGRYHRFTPAAYQIIGLMDGFRSVEEILELVSRRKDYEVPSQDEIVRLLSQLYAADVLQSDVLPDTDEQLDRYRKQQSMRWKQVLKAPLALRLPLFDPDRFLKAFLPLVKPLFSVYGAILWVSVIFIAMMFAAMHWNELSGNVADRLLSSQNLLVIWLTFPVVKAMHELGHAFAVRRWGGEVHELGIMLLVFTPVPYVEASSSTAFRSKQQRIVVGAAGMLVELFLASIALFVWLLVEPGLVSSIAYNVMFIAGVSTVLFNGNPLLRFDGYYILSDILEIPNLASRSNRYLLYLIERYLFGLQDSESPATAQGEPAWFLFFAIASFIYRIFVYLLIILFVAGKFFVIGLLFALWALYTMLILPVGKAVQYLLVSPRIRRCRSRALTISSGFASVLILIVIFLPLPLSTTAQGVVWVPDQALVRAGNSGFVKHIETAGGELMEPGQAVLKLEDPFLPVEAEVMGYELQGLQAKYRLLKKNDQVQAEITLEEIENTRARISHAQQRMQQLVVTSNVAGQLVLPQESRLNGRFVRQGDLLGYVVDRGNAFIRVVVPQSDVEKVRAGTLRVEVRLAEKIQQVIPARLIRQTPSASHELPTAALGSEGGGNVIIDLQEPGGRRAVENLFHFELEVPLQKEQRLHIGERVYVRFVHDAEPLASRWYREIRQLLLSRFSV